MRIATDIGGTFTDLVGFGYSDEGEINEIIVSKVPTTPPNFEKGILNGIKRAKLSPKDFAYFAHGTTVVINAITERKGAKTGLITTEGFRDVLEIARCNRPDLFNFNFKKPKAFVPRFLRRGVEERVNYKGEIEKHLNIEQLKEIINLFKKEKVEAVAICFLHSYRNPENEEKAKELIHKWWPEIEITTSSSVSREWREYERSNTAVLSAYVKPVTKTYINKLSEELSDKGLRFSPFIMQSNGGIATKESVKENPISIIESGPAGGILGSASLGRLLKIPNLLVLDIGGTTAKCSLIENYEVKIKTDYYIERDKRNPGYPLQTPVIDIVEIGNGGGSIAWIDQGGKMHVGPQSAGSVPGPASYGKGGGNPTTTDANLVLGRIHPDFFLGGEKKPDLKSLNNAFKKLEGKLNLDKDEIARGIVKIANSNMINALRLISVNKGYDPRDFVLVAIGGGGPMHAVELAEELQIKKIIIPPHAGVFSAVGMLLSDLRKDLIRTNVFKLESKNSSILNTVFSEMRARIINEFEEDNFAKEDIKFEIYADLRYAGQEHVVKVRLNSLLFGENEIDRIMKDFNKEHEKLYTYSLDNPVELVNEHVVGFIPMSSSGIPKVVPQKGNFEYDEVEIDFDEEGIHSAKVYLRKNLPIGMVINGPALIAESATSTLLPPGFSLTKDVYDNLIINKNEF